MPLLLSLIHIFGGGLPAAAYGGRKEIMACIAPDGSVYQAGTPVSYTHLDVYKRQVQ